MTRIPKWAALTAALASTLALALPAAAGAAVTSTVEDDILTVASNAASDSIVLAAAGGVITVNGTPTTLAANTDGVILVNAGEGADLVDGSALSAASYANIVVNAGPGEDTITTGAGEDFLFGEAGNDRLVGFKGVDEILAGEGDDVLVWNNGDGTDLDIGELGTDEVEVNGAPTAADEVTLAASPVAAGRALLTRTNLVGFEIDLSAERLTVNGLGGNDVVAPDPEAPAGIAGLTALTVNGGTGSDELLGDAGADLITGGAGPDELGGGGAADVLSGGDDVDSLFGGTGDDRLSGDRGGDLAAGDEGDDVIVWNNGDGSDRNEGAAGFDRVEVNGSAAAGDVFQLAPKGNEARFERTNLVPFTIDLGNQDDDPALPANGGVEAISVNGLAGDETFAVGQGLTTLLVAADGGAGNDTLRGSEEADSFFGGSGDDTIAPGTGSDLADGQDGSDRLLTRDAIGDLVRGGTGSDSAQTDAITVDSVDGIETLDATPTPAPAPSGDAKALLPRLGKVTVIRNGQKLVARVPVSCPAAEAGGCRTTLTLETAKAARIGSVRAVLVLGSQTRKLGAGQSVTVPVRLTSGIDQLVKRGKLAARVRVASSDATGNSAARSLAVGLKFPGA